MEIMATNISNALRSKSLALRSANKNSDASCRNFGTGQEVAAIRHALRDKSETVSRKSGVVANKSSMSGDDRPQSWQLGQLKCYS
jgi:hypothetical protein